MEVVTRIVVATLVLLLGSPSFAAAQSTTASPSVASSSRISIRRRQTTVSTSGWFRQPVGHRLTLLYLAGVSFGRLHYESEQEMSLSGLPTFGFAPPPTSNRIETVTYGVGPVIGFDAEIRLTEGLAAVSGIRFHSVSGWLVRPGVGLQWTF